MFPECIETDRLVLERLSIDHLFELYEHKKTTAPGIEEITRYVTWSPDRSLNETREFIEQQNEQWNDGKGATYLIRLGETECSFNCNLASLFRVRPGRAGVA